MTNIVMNEEFYTVAEVASVLRVSEQTVRTMIRRNELKASRVGRQWRINKKSFDEFVKPVEEN